MSEGNVERDDGNSLIKAYIQQGRGLESAINLYNDTADQYDKVTVFLYMEKVYLLDHKKK